MQRIANPSSSNSDARVRVSVSPQTQSPAFCGAFLCPTFSTYDARCSKKSLGGQHQSLQYCTIFRKVILSPEGAERGVNTKPLPCLLTADLHGGNSIHQHFQSYFDIVYPFLSCLSIALKLMIVHFLIDHSIHHIDTHFDQPSRSNMMNINHFPLHLPNHWAVQQKNRCL